MVVKEIAIFSPSKLFYKVFQKGFSPFCSNILWNKNPASSKSLFIYDDLSLPSFYNPNQTIVVTDNKECYKQNFLALFEKGESFETLQKKIALLPIWPPPKLPPLHLLVTSSNPKLLSFIRSLGCKVKETKSSKELLEYYKRHAHLFHAIIIDKSPQDSSAPLTLAMLKDFEKKFNLPSTPILANFPGGDYLLDNNLYELLLLASRATTSSSLN